MKGLSIRTKITLWFSLALILIAGLTILLVLTISGSVIQKGIRDNLIETVENNVDEVEYYSSGETIPFDHSDLYILYNNGTLEIDDDFLDSVNGVYTALYESGGQMRYGENPIASHTGDTKFTDASVQTVKAAGTRYYIYDRSLKGTGLEGLWLRGVVSEKQGSAQTGAIATLTLWLIPLLVIFAVAGGYLIAGRFLRPIKQIRDAAEHIRAGNDLTKRIHLGEGKDELHQLAATFNNMFQRLEHSFQSQNQFISDASHELRTPVSVIQSQCEYSLEKPRDTTEYIEALKLVLRQSGKMSDMIQALLSHARLEQAMDATVMQELDLSALADSVCNDLSLIQEKGIVLRHTIAPDIHLQGDAALLTQLLTNLIVNAYRYGKESGHIQVSLQDQGSEIELSVSDDGIGIPTEQQQRIWNRFYQADPSRGGKGLGLGLAMVKEIAALHGGHMTLESKENEGSTFVLHLPKS